MIVCHCNVVCEREIRAAVRRGATTPSAVARVCGAGTDCGGCREAVDEIIADAHGFEGRDGACEALVLAMVEETERSLVFPRSRV